MPGLGRGVPPVQFGRDRASDHGSAALERLPAPGELEQLRTGQRRHVCGGEFGQQGVEFAEQRERLRLARACDHATTLELTSDRTTRSIPHLRQMDRIQHRSYESNDVGAVGW
jgi:hypothetical protein